MTTASAQSLGAKFPALIGEGGFTMLALDQRESLRAMFADAREAEVIEDSVLEDFKSLGVKVLSPHASALLIDRQYGLKEGRPAGLAEGCGLILAVDVLHQVPGGAVTGTSLDETITTAFIRDVGADALKLLVIWRRGSGREERASVVRRFMELARVSGTTSLIEGIVRPDSATWATPGERDDAIIAAAAELSSFGPDIYKAEVPGYLPGDTGNVEAQSRRLTSSIDVPWVVLSNGVAAADFADAVRASRLGGSSGFLAGRAIWADVIGADTPEEQLREISIARLEHLSEIVRDTQA